MSNYICWSCYKEKFIVNNNINFLKELSINYPISFLQSTFRNQNSINWTDSRQAFEQNLKEKDISWFTYIKFYINNIEDIKPLVIGKTGSKLVNISGTDVSFSTDITDGPARKFLKENNYNWDKTKILIIPCENEVSALEIELKILNKYNLFSS